jgi:hypothetical protein
MRKHGAMLVSLLLVTLLLAGCACLPGETPPDETGYLRLLVSDDDGEDTAIGLFCSVNVTICGIAFQLSGSEEWIEPEDFEPVTVDLLHLIGTNATAIWEGYIEPGIYSKIRIHICGLTVALDDGLEIDVPLPPDGIIITIAMPFSVRPAGPTVNYVFDITIEAEEGSGLYRIVPVESESGPDQEYREVGEDDPEGEIKFKGTILAIAGDIWAVRLGDQEWSVNVSGAEIEGTPALGLMAEIEGTIGEDGVVLAVEVKLVNGE